MTPRLIRGKLPRGWQQGLAAEVVAEVRAIERFANRGMFVLSEPDHKGYRWVRLCVGHPYATRTGWQRLHRYLAMRALGKRIGFELHVHHVPGARKDTTDVYELELLEACDHGRWHWGARVSCGHHLTGWTPRDERGRFRKLPTPEAVVERFQPLKGGDGFFFAGEARQMRIPEAVEA